MLACVANVFLACFSFLIHKVTDTVIKAKHENDGGGEEGGKGREVFFPWPPPPPSFSPFSLIYEPQTKNKPKNLCVLFRVSASFFLGIVSSVWLNCVIT